VVVLLHGGSWIAGTRLELTPFAQYLAARGYAVVTPDYRLVPIFHYPAPIEDTRAALRWVGEHAEAQGFDLGRVALGGVSAGAQLAALVALTPGEGEPTVRAVLDGYGPMDFTAPAPDERALLTVQLYLGATRETKPDLYAAASPITHVSATAPPFFLAHGTADGTVPYAQSAGMAAALKAAGVPATLLTIEKGGHNLAAGDAASRDRVYAAAYAFLQEVMPAREP
jgi:acetyl esterase/lipase